MTQASRFNKGKPKFSLLDLRSFEPAVRVLDYGASKYGRDNYKKGLIMSEVLDSLMRHIAALQDNESMDLESKLTHIGHIQCNAMFLGNKNMIIDMEFNDDKIPLEEINLGKGDEIVIQRRLG
jgi:hypothetical protein